MNTARRLLLEQRSFWSGLEGRLLDEELADLFNLPPGSLGFLVKTVARGSPGEVLGLRGGRKTMTIDSEQIVVGGDIILNVQGIPVGTLDSYVRIRDELARLPPGATLSVTVLRAGRVIELTGRLP